MSTQLPGVSAPTDPVKTVFGESAEEIVASIRRTADALEQLGELFACIGEIVRRDDESPSMARYRIRRLAELGCYVANDIGSYTEDRHEQLALALEAFKNRT